MGGVLNARSLMKKSNDYCTYFFIINNYKIESIFIFIFTCNNKKMSLKTNINNGKYMKLRDWIPLDELEWETLSENPNAIHILEKKLG